MWVAVALVWLLSDLSGPPEKYFYSPSPYRSEVACKSGLPDVARAFDDFLKENGVNKSDVKVEFACERVDGA